MSEKDLECCKNCTFVHVRKELTADVSVGVPVDAHFCRRYPPSTIGIIRVAHNGWCGEWKEKENAKEI